MSVQYHVYVTPLESAGVYGDEVEISDVAQVGNGTTITRSIDSTDFAIGIYTFDDVSLLCDNSDGILSDPSDSRSIFKYSRDRAKVRIVYDQGDGSPTVTFKGLINDQGTTIDSDTDSVTFDVLGPDSVINSSTIPAGTISDGTTVYNALIAILNTSDITTVLGLNIANINPSVNSVIDVGSEFDNKNKKDALSDLLLASNSTLIIDTDWNIIIRNRFQNTSPNVLYLYGKNALGGTENIISIQSYNPGYQRIFNSVKITGGTPSVTVSGQTVTKPQVVESFTDTISPGIYGTKLKEVNLSFLTDSANMLRIAESIVSEFKYPKIELEVQVPTDVALDYDLLDVVSMDYPLRIGAPADGKFLPVIGITKLGDTTAPLPTVQGAVSIDPGIAFKIIAKSDNVDDYTTTLKLRQVGTTLTDGVFVPPLSVVTKTGNYQIQTTDDVILCDASSGAFAVTLPPPSSYPVKAYYIKKKDASINAVTVNPNVSELIDGAVSATLSALNPIGEFTTDGTNWFDLQNPITSPTINSQSSNYSATSSDDYIGADATSAGFTITLPDASTVTGQSLTIKKTDATFNAVTIDGFSTQTIDGALTTTLNTQYESIIIQSDGTNWQLIQRSYPSEWTSFTMTVIGTTSNPTKASSKAEIAMWRRVGDSMEIYYKYGQSATTGAADGSGSYLFLIPNAPSLTIDTTKIFASTAATLGFPGGYVSTFDGTTARFGNAVVYDSTHIWLNDTNGTVGSSHCNYTVSATLRYGFCITVPITGWN